MATPPDPAALRGSLWVLFLYDVAEEIHLDKLRQLLGLEPSPREPSFRHPTPEYVRFERPPVVEPIPPDRLEAGPGARARLKYFDFGVVSVEVEMPFETDWESLVQLAARWTAASDLESRAEAFARDAVARAAPAIEQPARQWLSEDYYAVHVAHALDDDTGQPLSTAALLAAHSSDIARIVRGETNPLSESERNEVLRARLSYYPNDLIVAGWSGAFLYDTPEAASPARQLLEYANTQLLEFRHYDELLTRVLAQVYDKLERGGGLLGRWRLGAEAERLNRIRLDVRELAERADNAIKFLSDMYYARAYRMASERVGVGDYRRLVEDKLRTAGDLYEFMTNSFHQARAFVLEFLIVAILVIELGNLFLFHR